MNVSQLPDIWSILPTALEKIKSDIQKIKPEDFKTCLFDENDLSFFGKSFFISDNVGVLQIQGPIIQRASIWSWFFGWATLDILTRDFKTLLDDNKVDVIILDFDSPGGSIFGIQEFAQMVFEAREQKPIISVSSSQMASAAYWIGAAANEIFITDNSVITGSIGVVATHIDVSELEKSLGIKVTEITAGKKKRITSNHSPLSEEGRAELQNQVDFLYNVFVTDIAKFRDVGLDDVLETMADGQIFFGNQGVNAGLVDNIIDSESLLQLVKNVNNFSGGKAMGAISKTVTKEIEAKKKSDYLSGLTESELKSENRNLYQSIFDSGVEQGKACAELDYDTGYEKGLIEGKAQGAEEGREKERERIKAVQDQILPGHEALIEKLKFDGKTTGQEAAIQVLNAERNKRGTRLDTIRAEAIKPVSDVERTETGAKDNSELSLEAQWEKSPEIREEFGKIEVFKAFKENEALGRVRILRKAQ